MSPPHSPSPLCPISFSSPPYLCRDPKHFGVILNCLRCGGGPEAAAKLLPAGRAEQLELQLEAQYYGEPAKAALPLGYVAPGRWCKLTLPALQIALMGWHAHARCHASLSLACQLPCHH